MGDVKLLVVTVRELVGPAKCDYCGRELQRGVRVHEIATSVEIFVGCESCGSTRTANAIDTVRK